VRELTYHTTTRSISILETSSPFISYGITKLTTSYLNASLTITFVLIITPLLSPASTPASSPLLSETTRAILGLRIDRVVLCIPGRLLLVVFLLGFEEGWWVGCWLVVVGFGMMVRLVVRGVGEVVGVIGRVLWWVIGEVICLEVFGAISHAVRLGVLQATCLEAW
jgi:hypothetical protein